MDRLEWRGSYPPRYGHGHGNTTSVCAFNSKAREIMSKYRPIAPKPTLHLTSNPSQSKANSDSNLVMDSCSRFPITRKENNTTESSRPNKRHRRASDCCNIPSPKANKRARSRSNATTDLQTSESSTQIAGTSVPASRIAVNRPKLVYPFDVCHGADKFSVEKHLGVMEKAAASALTQSSVLDIKAAGLEVLNVINSNTEASVHNHATAMELVAVQKMPSTQCGCGSAKYLVFPIVNDIQQQQEVDKNRKNVATLRLLPQTPYMNDLPLGDPDSNVTADEKPKMDNTSILKQEFQLRLFGRDLSQKEVGTCEITSKDFGKG